MLAALHERIKAEGNGAAPLTSSRRGARATNQNPSDPQADSIRHALRHALDHIESTGSFASARALPSMDPCLVVENIGKVNLPLQEHQARQIIDKCRQAPYGKGDQTIVDTSIRNTWELDSSQFEMQSSKWPDLLAAIVSLVGKDFGVNAPIRAELYKMLVYEQGAMFKAHTDSPKIPGMFATLVICLPSAHTGGDVIVKHRHEKKVLKSSEMAQGFMCWYSDVQHEVLPVTSGYRWVLTYNLALDPSEAWPSAGLQQGDRSQLRGAVSRWLARAGDSEKLQRVIYALDHHYTEAALSLQGFKGRDLVVAQALRDISSELPMDIFLGTLEKTDEGSCEDDYYDEDWHSLDEVYDTHFAIASLVDLDGVHLADDVELDEKSILQRDCFEDVDGEEISYEEGYAGNEMSCWRRNNDWLQPTNSRIAQGGPSATHAYRVSGIILVPRDATPAFLQTAAKVKGYSSSSTKNLVSLLAYFSERCQEPSKDASNLLILKSLCEHQWASKPLYSFQVKPKLDKTAASKLLQTVVRMRDWGFFERAVENLKGNIDLEFFARVKGEIGNGLPFAEVQKPLLQAVLSLPVLSFMLEAVRTITPPQPDADEVRDWERTALERSLDAAESMSLGDQDGASVVSHCVGYRDIEYIQARVVPVMEKQAKQTSFCFGFLGRAAHEVGRSPPAQRRQWMSIFEAVARSMISAMDIPTMVSVQTLESPSRRAPYHAAPTQDQDQDRVRVLSAVKSDWLGSFWKNLLEKQAPDHLTMALSSKIVAEADRIPPEEFNHLWIPLLQDLIPALEDHSVPFSTPRYQALFAAVLDAFLTRWVGPEPAKPTSLVRPTVPCACGDCARLNAFLAHPALRKERFPMGKQRRQHLHSQLDAAGVDCTHVTEHVGSPHTLVVNKTTRQADAARREWRARQARAEETMRGFPAEALRMLLGREHARIVSMEGIRLGSGSGRSVPTGGVAGAIGGSRRPPSGVGAGRKRKAVDVIDLTGAD